MARYIDADKIISHLNDEIEACGDIDINCYPINYGTYLGLKSSKSFVETAETADVQEVRHGHWITKDLDNFRKIECKCSECGYIGISNYDSYDDPYDFNYCPNCGALMDGDEDEPKATEKWNKRIYEEEK